MGETANTSARLCGGSCQNAVGISCLLYTKQRLQLVEIEMKLLFESDKVKQKGLAVFM